MVLPLLPLILHMALHLLQHPLRLSQALHILHHLRQMLLGPFLLVERPEQGGEEGEQQAAHDDVLQPGLAIKNPPKKKPKKPPKNPLKMFFWVFFGVFLNFLFFMNIIQTFLFETDFL